MWPMISGELSIGLFSLWSYEPTYALATRSKRSRFITLAHAATKVTHERLLRVVAGIDFRDGSELRVRTEDEVDGGAGPLDLARPAVAPLVEVLALGGLPPLRAHVEQVHEEVVGQ